MKKTIVVLTAAGLLCFVALWVYVESDAFAERLRPYIVRPLMDVLGPRSQVGRVRITLLPFVVEVRDIVVPSDQSAEIIAVRKVRAYINPLPLLWKRVLVSSVTVLEPRVSGARSRDGTLDLSVLFATMQENIARLRGTGPTSFTVHVRSITLSNGSIVLSDAASGANMAVHGLDSKAIFRSTAAEGMVRISSGSVSISLPSYPSWEGSIRATASFAGNAISISDLELRSRSARYAVSGTFLAARAGALDLRIQARVGRGVLGDLSGMARLRGREALIDTTASLTGTFSEPQLKGTAMVAGFPFNGYVVRRAGLDYEYARHAVTVVGKAWELEHDKRRLTIDHIAAEAGYDQGIVRIVKASLKADDTEMEASGTVSIEKGYDIALSIVSDGTGPVLRFFAGLESSGRISLSGALTGQLNAPLFDGTVSAGPVTIRTVTFQGLTGMVQFRDRTISLMGATIRQDASRYLLDVSVNLTGDEPYYQARLGIIRSDVISIIALFYKPIPLDLSASGEMTFSGTSRTFSGKGHLDLDAGAAYGESFEKGSVEVELTSSRVVFPRVLIDKGGGRIEGRGWIEFRGAYYASIESSGVDVASVDHLRMLSLDGPMQLSIRSSGNFSSPQVNARAVSPGIRREGLELGAAEWDLVIQDHRLTLAGTLGSEGDSGVSMNGHMELSRPYPWSVSARFHLADVDPSMLAKGNGLLAKVRVSATGRISLQGQAGSGSAISGNAVLQSASILVADHRIENEGEAIIRIEQGDLSVQNMVLTGTGTRLSISGGLRSDKKIDLTLMGEVNLSLLRLLYKEVEHGDGIATVRLSLHDDWRNPVVDGRVTVKDGMLKLRDIPQRLSGLNGVVVFDRERITTEGLSADVGGGRARISGSARLRDTALLDFSLRAVFEDVTVRYPAGLTATLAGTLYYDGDRQAQTLSGEISIGRAKYEKRIEWKSMLVDFTQGIMRKKKTDIGWIGETRLNVRFTGSENILFESNLAEVPLKIDLLFQGTVNQIQLLGRIEAREGKVYFRNNVFDILFASADFVDPGRINPVLDVQAETRVREYRIRLGVSGNADRAVVTFLSDPPLEDSDILALLAVGRKGEELEGKADVVGRGESLSFVSGRFQDLLESRARSLTGLDRFQIDPYINKSDTPVPRVTVGKEIVEKRVFLTYSSNVGGTTPEQNLRVEYILNRNISLLGEYDELGQIGADLKFRFEFR